ncbi:MAG TPA: sulfatase-like hydrolase/transferase [Thermoanaerobaculia bacterium]|nr:sulfatase-like hydrolase/transferase [Thermoanaerobaculia bacterium]
MSSEAATPSRRQGMASGVRMLAALVLLLWPLVPMALASRDAQADPLPQLASWTAFTAAAVVVAGVAHAIIRRRFATAAGAVAGLYATICTLLAAYRLAMHDWLDLEFLLAIPSDSVKTAYKSLGAGRTAMGVLALLVCTALYAVAFASIARTIAKLRGRTRYGMAAAALTAVSFVTLPHTTLLLPTENLRTAPVPPLFPKASYTVTPGESVFIVQLESLNGIAINGEYDVGDPGRRGASETLRLLGRDGIYFPYVWSHDVQTHRAQQSILCGSVRNLRKNSVFEQRAIDRPCMPELFRAAGYRTVFLSSYTDPLFGKTRDIAERSGFTDIHFSDYMQRGDKKALWGYEENAFFRRSFEYLRKTYRPDERLLVFFVVTAHHVGFSRRRMDDTQWFVDPREKQVAKYLESARHQDESLQTFRDEFMRFTGGAAHLLVTGDHSYPLGLYKSIVSSVGATVDNYITSMLYVPPKQRAPEFATGKVVKEIHGHSDILPTIAELVSRKPQENSLVPVMLRASARGGDYERCHVMVQPFDLPSVTVAREKTMYTYRFSSSCILKYTLTFDPLRQNGAGSTCGVSYADFERLHGCARYRRP